MGIEMAPAWSLERRDHRLRRRRRWRLGIGLGVLATVALLAAALVVHDRSAVTLSRDGTALARVEVQLFGGRLARARAFGPNGRPISLVVRDGLLLPRARLTPGERISVEVVVRRPGWLGWALGSRRRERLRLQAPIAHVSSRWLTVASGSPVRVRFDRSVSAVGYGTHGRLVRQALARGRRSIALPGRAPAGAVQVAVAARSWERLGAPVAVRWFPRERAPVALTSPPPGARLAPAAPIRLTFSQPVATLLGSARPVISPRTAGHWRQIGEHTLVFVPAGFGSGLATELHLEFPRPLAVSGASGRRVHVTRQIDWTVPPGSTLRLQQLLAQAGYLPLDWKPSAPPVARTARAQLRAAVDPPSGRFTWRYPNTPGELQSLWAAGRPNDITRGAVMTFQDEHGLVVDGLVGPVVWHAVIADAIAAKRRDRGYSYVYVHRNLPQSLNLWHNGDIVVSSPGNTGVPAAPTQLGTFPVFEHIPVGTMSGTNPDGSHYNDPGIRYISYFNGGDAIHAFTRASFGTPQSLGCVELPLASAARVWPYTPIGTLVTIEN